MVQNNSAFIALSDIKNELIQSIAWQSIAPGSSNLVYRGCCEQSSYILRINASTEFAYGVCREREASVLDLIKGQPWAPNIIEYNSELGWCLMQDHGASLQIDKGHEQTLLTMLNNMHQFSASVSVAEANNISFDYQQLFAGYHRLLSGSDSNALALALCKELAIGINKLPDVRQVLMHQDLHPHNVCVGTGMVMIDWEYAGWGGPWLDTAALNHAFNIPEQKLRQLSIYQTLDDWQFKRGLNQALAINSAISCIWYWLRWYLLPETVLSQSLVIQREYQESLERQASACLKDLKRN